MSRRRPIKPARRLRRHGDLPSGFQWNDGNPRWIPSPTRRAQGWSPCWLRDGRGARLSRGEAIGRAEAINVAVIAWADRGDPVPAAFRAFAPRGSCDGAAVSPGEKADRRSIGGLVDAWLASSAFTLPREQGGLAPTTQADYRSKIGAVLLAVVRGDATKLDALRALPIETFAVAAEEDDDDNPLEAAYLWLLEHRGHAMAYGALSVAGAFFSWCWKKKRIAALAANPVDLIDRRPPDGKIRIRTPAELAAMVASADALGLSSIGDAAILGLDLGWSLQDVLRLDRRRVVRRAGGWVVARNARGKTGVVTSDIPLSPIAAARLDAIIARTADQDITPLVVVVREASPRNRGGGQWDNRGFNDAWRTVRDHAGRTQPSVLGLNRDGSPSDDGAFDFKNLRDTMITLAREAGMSIEETCSRCQHSTSRVHAVWQKHYGAITPVIAASGAARYGDHLASGGWTAALT